MDGSAAVTADWVARIPARVDCGETRFPPVGMELDVSGYDTKVAACGSRRKELNTLVLRSPRTLGTDEGSLSYECRKLLIRSTFGDRRYAFG
ncbi:hypothetical protein AXG93_2053s1080 [Marchantia polymorpha subsp. ruderalis]|uniref:Uncharacterized protein n=1 Tax=Marchantia polymorpha subsp. ruderalis TaxID=1480154 RepID=A0A176VRN5_MARPO|nr:hypothetical protein AXG93_2053s1080 [Marchantia polymorpha subsp. ruderalis]